MPLIRLNVYIESFKTRIITFPFKQYRKKCIKRSAGCTLFRAVQRHDKLLDCSSKWKTFSKMFFEVPLPMG